ncbi:hypothetical protein [Bordetella sp. 15P40C-2]|uniref:hypothetical protein n=1 Tax=Bordetella sp. 15P40C-2 TaxID=2572246 RepID=UPI001328452D|nr:hypothetical protein [Bordetella sp. 15P40C-2]MVW72173.1 hypothetical protein [Bordetella sp. 15P40C-2]
MNIDKEREAFEAWAVGRWPGVNLSPDQSNCGIVVYERYKHPKLQAAWEAWQARAALGEQKAGPSDNQILFEWSQTKNTGDMRVDLVAFARALLSKYAAPQPSGDKWDSEAAAAGRDKDSGLTRWNPLPGGGMNPHPRGLYVRAEDVPKATAAPEPNRKPAIPAEIQIIEAAERAGLWPNTVREWIPQFQRYHQIIAAPVNEPDANLEALHTFLDAAAGEGLVFNGVDAADLYISIFRDRYNAAIAQQGKGEQ